MVEPLRAAVASARASLATRAPSIPEGVRDELNTSIRRFAAVRTPKDLITAIEEETGRLSEVVVPLLAEHPLPIHGQRRAEVVAALTGASGAAVAEAEGLIMALSATGAAPTMPLAGAGLLVAFVLEVWIAVSARVHAIRAAGREVDTKVLASVVAASLLGVDMNAVKHLAKRAAHAVGKRVARRWALGLAPVAGIVIDGAAARRTVRAIGRLPVDAHPRVHLPLALRFPAPAPGAP